MVDLTPSNPHHIDLVLILGVTAIPLEINSERLRHGSDFTTMRVRGFGLIVSTLPASSMLAITFATDRLRLSDRATRKAMVS